MAAENKSILSGMSISEGIRRLILTGEYSPGGELPIATISEGFDASMAEVREALLQLVEQRLVVRDHDEIFRVVSVSRRDLEELTALRELVEGTALRSSVELGDDEWERAVSRTFRALEAQDVLRGRSTEPSAEWRSAHLEFHDALCAGTASSRLLQLSRTLRNEAEIYRGFSGAAGEEAQHRDVAAEHRSLRDLAIARKADDAVEALRLHLEGTKIVLLATILPD